MKRTGTGMETGTGTGMGTGTKTWALSKRTRRSVLHSWPSECSRQSPD